MEPLSSARSSDDNTVHSGSRIARTGTTDKDRERERKEKEKLDKEREKADKKEKERLEKEKKKDDKEQAKLVKSGSKEPTPRTDDPRQLNCLWIDKVRVTLLCSVFVLLACPRVRLHCCRRLSSHR